MKLKNNKGFTGVDIGIAIFIIIAFVSIISTLSYNINISAKRVERKGEASYIAVQIIEKMKKENFDNVTTNMNFDDFTKLYKGYTVSINVQSYEEYLNIELSEPAPIKIATVKIEYKVGKTVENLEISTVLVKRDI